jgi:hypothetical protein
MILWTQQTVGDSAESRAPFRFYPRGPRIAGIYVNVAGSGHGVAPGSQGRPLEPPPTDDEVARTESAAPAAVLFSGPRRYFGSVSVPAVARR